MEKDIWMQTKTAQLLDLYTDYLLSSVSKVTATGMSAALDGAYSHDQITRLLTTNVFDQKTLWYEVKPTIRKIETDDGVIIVDDTIEEKPYTDQNEIVCYHWDHAKDRSVKGINLVHFLYHQTLSDQQDMSIPVSYEIVRKTATKTDLKTGKTKRYSTVTKNEMVRDRLKVLTQLNQLKFRYVLWDIWFNSNENITFVKKELKKDVIGAIKANRLAALTPEDRLAGRFQSISQMDIMPDTPVTIYLKGVKFPLLLVKHVFTNDDGSTGTLYLISTDVTLTADRILALYHKRWKVEVFHKSVKQNAALEKSPTKAATSQSNHIFATLLAFVKLEQLKLATQLNHFALKNKLYLKAMMATISALKELKKDVTELNQTIGLMPCQTQV